MAEKGGPPDGLWNMVPEAASSMLAAGVSPRVVQDILGHRSVAMTLGLYSHVTPALVADAVARVEALVGRA